MELTARFQIPMLVAGQAQKEFFHNEALERISMLLCPVVEGVPQAQPPQSPAIGTCYLVATGGTGDWAGQDSSVACYSAGGWRFVAPIEGVSVLSRSSGETLQWRSGSWEAGIARVQEVRIDGQTVLRGRQPAIQNPTGGAVVDSENRAAVTAILGALRTHGMIG